jgi:hypothetical protein
MPIAGGGCEGRYLLASAAEPGAVVQWKMPQTRDRARRLLLCGLWTMGKLSIHTHTEGCGIGIHIRKGKGGGLS